MKNQELSATQASVLPDNSQSKNPGSTNFITAKNSLYFFGRQQEQAALYQKILEIYKDKKTGFIQIEGEGGIGKTTLVQQVLNLVKTDQFFQWYGKHDNRIEKIPYWGLKQAFHHWMEYLLTLDDLEFEKLKNAIRKALNNQPEVLTSVFEELELLIGKSTDEEYQPTPADAQQARMQFTYFFQKFLVSLADSGYNTILVLDDLQWADRATLDLLNELINFYEIPNFIIIGINRPLGVGPEQAKLQKLLQGDKVTPFTIQPLDREAIRCFIPENWNLKKDELFAFEEYLIQESEGNPFFAKEIIDYVESEQSHITNPEQEAWLQWDRLPKLRQNVNAITLVQHKLVGLSVLAKEVILTASSLGFYFSYRILSEICHIPKQDFATSIKELEEQHFILRQNDHCFFIHDNIYAAAYGMLGRRKTDLHYHIGNYLKGLTKMNVLHPLYFEMVNHLNLAQEKITDTLQQIELSILNHMAGQLAKKKSAFDRALGYFMHCDTLLMHNQLNAQDFVACLEKLTNTPQPESFYKFYINNLLGKAETQFLIHEYELALDTLKQILDLDQDRFTNLQAYTIHMKICIACINKQDLPHMLMNGLQITEHVLYQYQIHLPQTNEDYEKEIMPIFEKVKTNLDKYEQKDLFEQPVNQNPEFIDLIRFIVHALPLMFFKDVNKAKYLSLISLQACMERGFVPSTPALFASSIWTVFSINKNYDLGLKLGEIALQLIKREPYKNVAQQVYHLSALNFYNWKHHYRDSAQLLYDATEIALEQGDYNYAVFCASNARLLQLFMGMNLKEHPYAHFNQKVNRLEIHFLNRSNVNFVNYMNGNKPGFTEGKFLFSKSLIREAQYNPNFRYHYYHVKEKLFFFSGQYEKSYKAGQRCEEIYKLYETFQIVVEHNFYYALNLLQLIHENPELKAQHLPAAKDRWQDLHKLAFYGSGNYLHKKWLLEAEISRCEDNYIRAVQLYDRAIAEGMKTGFVHVAAIAAEMAGNYMLYLQRDRLAVPYFKEAYKYYKQWGAQAKLRWLENKFPDTFKENIQELEQEKEIFQQTGSSLSDVTTVYQTVMALSKELTVHGVISTFLRISMMHVQADRGVFLLKEKQNWRQVAERKGQSIQFYSDFLKSRTGSIPEKLVNYVIRKKEKMWMSQATAEKILWEPYFNKNNTQAAAVIPVFHHEDIIGLLYLEKNLTGNLAKDQLQVLDTLATQAGISLTNALMYEDLQRLNQELQKQEQKRVEAIIESQEKERKRVAEELHDNLGQMLSLVKLNFSRLEDHVTEEKDLYLRTSEILDESCSELRKIAHNIMPPDFEKKTLVEIIDAFLRKYVSASGLDYEFDPYQVPNNISVAIKFNVYRVMQEIIHNILKHAQASKITLQLIGTEEGMDMMVEDNGKGFDVNFFTGGIGLQNIISRINLLKGTVEVDSSAQRGTIYNIHLPLSN